MLFYFNSDDDELYQYDEVQSLSCDVDVKIAQERLEEAKALEHDLVQLYEINTDLALLVGDQSDGIDQIVSHTEKAAENTEQGVQHLVAADQYQQRSLNLKTRIMTGTSIGVTVTGGLVAIFNPIVGIITVGLGVVGIANSIYNIRRDYTDIH